MTTLKSALKEGKLDQFIKEHENDAPGDLERFDKALKRPADQKKSAAREASSRAASDD